MADDRMYLRCRCCGESIMVDKMWKSRSWFINNTDVNDFIEKHQYCGDSVLIDREMDSFELATENGVGYASISDDVKWTLNLKDIKKGEQFYKDRIKSLKDIIEPKDKEIELLKKRNKQLLDNIQELKNMIYNKEHNEDK